MSSFYYYYLHVYSHWRSSFSHRAMPFKLIFNFFLSRSRVCHKAGSCRRAPHSRIQQRREGGFPRFSMAHLVFWSRATGFTLPKPLPHIHHLASEERWCLAAIRGLGSFFSTTPFSCRHYALTERDKNGSDEILMTRLNECRQRD